MRTARALAAVVVGAVCLPLHAADCANTSTGLVPLTDLGTGLYLGQFQGGLYPGGLNVPPPAMANAAANAAASITPRNALGQPSQTGKYVLLSIGMSNTTQEFCGGPVNACASYSFAGQAAASLLVNHTTLAIVDGASGGQTADTWDSPTDANFDRVRDTRLAAFGLSEAQVQAAWIKVAQARPTNSLPDPNADAIVLEREIGEVVRAMRVRYPNLRMVFLSSRIYAGYASSELNPEPYAYESGFACKWVIQAQFTQRSTGVVDPIAGDLGGNTPVILWGPYLWADGLTPRSDGLTWECTDLVDDGTHPSPSGRQKVGTQLLNFMLGTCYTAEWFRADGLKPCVGDYNCSGGVTLQDLFSFLEGYFSVPPDPRADVNDSGAVSVQDLFDYLAGYFGGC